jgi:hypothetical protein
MASTQTRKRRRDGAITRFIGAWVDDETLGNLDRLIVTGHATDQAHAVEVAAKIAAESVTNERDGKAA